jgi:hypothetical protein
MQQDATLKGKDQSWFKVQAGPVFQFDSCKMSLPTKGWRPLFKGPIFFMPFLPSPYSYRFPQVPTLSLPLPYMSTTVFPCFAYTSITSSKTLVTYQTTWHQIPEDSSNLLNCTLHQHDVEEMKHCMYLYNITLHLPARQKEMSNLLVIRNQEQYY